MDHCRESGLLDPMKPSAEYQIQFLSNLQRLLAEGQFVATYKYALLLAIADIAVALGDDSGHSMPIETRTLPEKFVDYYWQQGDDSKKAIAKAPSNQAKDELFER